ncbi:GAF domain-containing protein [Sporichthya sp.]|uniref:helix-turn-helix domain-containing protein n=1 Tax=Sporichthya sp. TaxID=65475 RepID=UPI00184DEB13|nr:GAF domain-containing protein [Sporichthya sp.]MBA3744486.1 GAF domain-containing protein [Sporichthya sp.]
MRRSSVAAFDAFADIALEIHEGRTGLTEVLDLIAKSAAKLLETDIAWLVLVDPAEQQLRAVVLVGFRSERFLDVSLPIEAGVVGLALAQRKPVVVEDYRVYEHPTSEAVRSVIDEEGISSLICCPLFRSDQSIGALYVGRRRPSTFSHDDVRLLEALAGQTSVAIENQRLYTRLREQNDLLARSVEIHDQFTQASLRGVGLAGIAGILSRLLERPVRIEPSVLGLPSVTFPTDADLGGLRPGTREVITANDRTLGALEVFHDEPLSALDVTAVEHSRTICGLELVKVDYAGEIERRYSSRLLDDLLDAGAQDRTLVEARARQLRLDLTERFRIIVIQASVPLTHPQSIDDMIRAVLHQELGSRQSQVLLTKRSGRAVAAVPESLQNHTIALVDNLRAELVAGAVRGSVGVGPLVADIRRAYAAADACVSLSERSASSDGGVEIVSYDDLGPMNFLLDAPSIEFAQHTVVRLLGPLQEHDRRRRMQLVPTLREYLATNGHHGQTCARLYIGETTLKYRLAKIADLLAVDLRDPGTRFELQLALAMLRFVDTRVAGQDSAPPSS